MAYTTNMLSAILVTCFLQVMVSFCQSPASNLTQNISTDANNTSTNSNNVSTNANNVSTNANNTLKEDNSNLTLGYVNSSAEVGVLIAEGSSAEEVLLQAGTPVMSDCVNGSSDYPSCTAQMLNVTLQCANETGATQDDVDIAMRMEIPSSDTGKCLTRCLLKYRGVMSPEGAFAPSATVSFLTAVHKNESLEEEFQKLSDYCYGKLKLQPMSSLDSCQFAYDIATCTEEYHKTLFLRNPAMAPPVNAITTP